MRREGAVWEEGRWSGSAATSGEGGRRRRVGRRGGAGRGGAGRGGGEERQAGRGKRGEGGGGVGQEEASGGQAGRQAGKRDDSFRPIIRALAHSPSILLRPS